MRPAVILLSGGLDSTTVCALAQAEGFELHALTVDYGQRHAVELAAARRVAGQAPPRHHRRRAEDDVTTEIAKARRCVAGVHVEFDCFKVRKAAFESCAYARVVGFGPGFLEASGRDDDVVETPAARARFKERARQGA